MRCATQTTLYAFTGTGTTRGTYEAMTISTTDEASCPVGQYVVMTQAEANAAAASPFNLTLAEAGPISGAILALWALGFGIRMLIRTIRESSSTYEVEQ